MLPMLNALLPAAHTFSTKARMFTTHHGLLWRLYLMPMRRQMQRRHLFHMLFMALTPPPEDAYRFLRES